MSEPESKWRSNLYALILHTTEPRVLMLQVSAHWTLPRFQFARTRLV